VLLGMNLESFRALVRQALDSLPAHIRQYIDNVAVIVEEQPSEEGDDDLLLGTFQGVARTEASFFDMGSGPSRIVLYKKAIEARAREIARSDPRPLADIIEEEVRLTVLHEFGHYFGLDENALEDV
jgi:predicted Zn-dependent protease with MMP-like domain